MADDEEKAKRTQELIGFAGMASFIANDKEHSSAIFQLYETLAARNLLYLQAELRELEIELEELDKEDAQSQSVEVIQLAMDWQFLKERAKSDSCAEKRVNLVAKLRSKIKEYQEAILRNAEILKLQRPPKQVFNAFKNHFHNYAKQDQYPRLAGISEDLYDRRKDLISLVSTHGEDRLTTILREQCPWLFQRRSRPHHDRHTAVSYMSETKLNLLVSFINILVATGMLFGAIYSLFYVKDEKKRLGLIAGYTVLFALCIGLLTNAKRSEIFSAGAAYAAVLVVFVSGDFGNQ